MTSQLKEEFLEAYESLDREYDYYSGKMDKYEEEGNKEKAIRAAQHADEITAEMKGMRKVLHMLGYTLHWQYNRVTDAYEYVIVYK